MKTKAVTLNTAKEILVFLEANNQIPLAKMLDIVKTYAPEAMFICLRTKEGKDRESECKQQLLSWIENNIDNLDNPEAFLPLEIFSLQE
jgi:hypothetical protein